MEGVGSVGTVSQVVLDKPVWATEAYGVEITLGVLSSADIAAHGAHLAEMDARVSEDTANAARGALRYRPLPTTPAAEFDLALLIPDGTSAGDVEKALKRAGGDLLERTMLFDEFRGVGVPDGFRSLAWRLTFRHPERTLRDKEIEGRRNQLLKSLADDLGIRPRAS